MIDQYYTPPELAKWMIQSLPSDFLPATVADFAAGEGSLLRAASHRWPEAKLLANDCCTETSRILKDNNQSWIVSCADFMNNDSLSRSNLIKHREDVDLILLNPPFSQRGVKPLTLEGTETITCGLALAFVAKALTFLKADCFAVAIVPDGCLTSIRDKKAREYLEKKYSIQIVRRNPDTAFLKARARTSILLIQNRSPASVKQMFLSSNRPVRQLFRGRFQMHNFDNHKSDNGLPLIHSTSLKDGEVIIKDFIRIDSKQHIFGPCMLLPRVGNVTPKKISILSSGTCVILSDCVIAVCCNNEDEAVTLRAVILENWEEFENLYSGTGARYITLARASRFIEEKVENTRIAQTVSKLA